MKEIPPSRRLSEAIEHSQNLLVALEEANQTLEAERWMHRAVEEIEVLSQFEVEARRRLTLAETQSQRDNIEKNRLTIVRYSEALREQVNKILTRNVNTPAVLPESFPAKTNIAGGNPPAQVLPTPTWPKPDPKISDMSEAQTNNAQPRDAVMPMSPRDESASKTSEAVANKARHSAAEIVSDDAKAKSARFDFESDEDLQEASSYTLSAQESAQLDGIPLALPKTRSYVFWLGCLGVGFLGGLANFNGDGFLMSLLVVSCLSAVYVGFWWQVIGRAGWPAWWSFGMLVPILNAILMITIAFVQWPIDKLLRQQSGTWANGAVVGSPISRSSLGPQNSAGSSGGANAFNRALNHYNQLAVTEGEEYKKVLYKVVKGCQEAISANRQDGDAMVMLANAYYLVAISAVPGQHDHDMTLRAAHVMQYWFRTKPRTQPTIAENARKLDPAIREATSKVLQRDASATATFVSMLPPGHLEDSLRDRLAVGTTLFPKAFGVSQ